MTRNIMCSLCATKVSAAAGKDDWSQVIALLDPAGDLPFGIKRLAAEDAAALQRRCIVDHILRFARTENSKNEKDSKQVAEAVDSLRSFVGQVMGDRYILDFPLKAETEKLHKVLMAPTLTDQDEIQQAERARDELVAAKDSLFNKVITVFATGIAARTEADKFFERIHADKGHAVVPTSFGLFELAGFQTYGPACFVLKWNQTRAIGSSIRVIARLN